MSSPSFLAYVSSTVSNATGDSSAVYPIPFDSVAFNDNANFNTSTGLWTAPADGRLTYSAQVVVGNVGASHTSGAFSIVQNGVSNPAQAGFISPAAIKDASSNAIMQIDGIMEVSINDSVGVFASVSGGSKVVSVVGTATPITYFCGTFVAS